VTRLIRLIKIFYVIARYRLDTFVNPERLTTPLRFLFKIAPWHLFKIPEQSEGYRLRRCLEELGPIFIKFGQMLSTRRDLLDPDIANELSALQDQVPPFPKEQAVQIIEQALGQPVDEIFAEFNAEPLASASVAQVHPATLHSGQKVVVKVIRPGIERTIREDIALLYTLARFIHRFHPDGKRLRPVDVVNDYKITIFDELDLQREAANTSQLRRNFEGSDLLYVPEVFWDYTKNNVFVMERIHGIPISDRKSLLEEKVDLKELAERGVKIFFTQVFRDSFFHADMHPGNIFVSTTNPDKPQYIGIDCAIMGTLSDFDQYYLARNLLAIFKRDYRQVAELHIECGWVPRETRVGDFESAIRSACEPIFEKPLGEISFGQLLIYLFQTARRFNMEVQPSLVLLQKTLLHVEGLGRELYPELDLWNTAQPFLEQWVEDRYSPKGILERVQKFAPSWLEKIPQRPELLLEGWQRAEQASNAYQSQQRQLDSLQRTLENRSKRQRANIWISTTAMLGIYWLNSGSGVPALQNLHPASWVLAAVALYLLVFRQ
jgi:ubiquinone biosynthesis protein